MRKEQTLDRIKRAERKHKRSIARGVHIHNDGKGNRAFFVDGREVKRVWYADEKRGVVRVYDDPVKIHKHRKRAISRTIRGNVTVAWTGR